MRTALLLVPVLLLVGCSWWHDGLPLDPGLPPSNLDVHFSEAPPDTAFEVETGEGVIIVRDRTITGVCHTRENRGAYLHDDIVTLWIAHTGRKGDVCIALGVPGAYEAIIEVPPGPYTLRVEYIGDIDSDTYPRPELAVQVEVD